MILRLARLACILIMVSPPTLSQDRLYYHNLPYGSQAVYNPISVILNGSYDIIQMENRSREIFTLPYGSGTTNVFHNLGSPFSMISEYGWGNFIRREVLPLSFTVESGQWWPNYELHLVGGGMTSVMMREWYEDHGFSSPMVWSIGTMAAYHLLNEIVESGESFSVGAGVRAVSLKLLDPEFFLLTTVLKWEVGFFYDRNNSLLASLFIGGSYDNPVTLNIYPGVLKFSSVSPGVWALYSRQYGFTVGLTTVWVPGIAWTGKD